MHLNQRPQRCGIILSLFCCTSTALAANPAINGQIEQVGPFRVLRVWGSPQEMGFAHGALLADDIVAMLSEEVAADPARASEAGQKAMAALIPFVDIPDRVMEELRGIMEGIETAKGGMPKVAGLGRAFALDDLVIRNAGDLLRAYGCSGFSVWGEQAGEHGVITTRNFDYPAASRRMLDAQLIIVRQPTGRRQVMSVVWPGYIGAFTSVNEDGVCAFMHDGSGDRMTAPDRKRTPLGLAIADGLERSNSKGAFADMEASLKRMRNYPFSYIVRMVTPRVGTGAPAHVFHIDKQGVGSNPTGKTNCITTNHYLTRNRKPVRRANAWSLTRYGLLEAHLASTMTREAAWEAQRMVASDNQAYPTLHTLIVYPESRMIDLAFASWKGDKVIPATANEPTQISFDQLFARTDSTD